MKEYLDADDIMIGDIIRYADKDKPQRATLDTLIDIKKGAKVVGVRFTKEDLEQVGLRNIPSGDVWCVISSFFRFTRRGDTEPARGERDGGRTSTILYFHELQHIFRALNYDLWFDNKYQSYHN